MAGAATPPPCVVVSAPGKVLLAGGYLVLDRQYTGLVFGLSARIHVAIHRQPVVPGSPPCEIIVRSPQFTGALWKYECYSAGKTGDDVQVRFLNE
jgi:phosphomevalonate kinase